MKLVRHFLYKLQVSIPKLRKSLELKLRAKKMAVKHELVSIFIFNASFDEIHSSLVIVEFRFKGESIFITFGGKALQSLVNLIKEFNQINIHPHDVF